MARLYKRSLALYMQHLPAGIEGLRILHLSDLHLRRWTTGLSELHEALQEQTFDLLLYTGDFCHRPEEMETAAHLCRRLFENVRPEFGMYGVLGNHDDARFAHQDLPVELLRNRTITLDIGPDHFHISGIEQSATCRSCFGDVGDPLDVGSPHIVLAHYPSTVFELPAGAEVLMLAGHTHGGQIRLPGLGCMYTNDRIPRNMARGLHAVRGNRLHVSAGLGVSWWIPARFNCPPEITILTLVSTDKQSELPGPPRIPSRSCQVVADDPSPGSTWAADDAWQPACSETCLDPFPGVELCGQPHPARREIASPDVKIGNISVGLNCRFGELIEPWELILRVL